jgi:hypothetical protein
MDALAQQLPGAPSTPSTSPKLASPPSGVWLAGGRSYLGLNLAPSRSAACSSIALTCENTQPAVQVRSGTMFSNFWGVELAYSNASRVARLAGDAPAQGLTVSLLGRTQLMPSVGLYGRLGTTHGRGEPTAMNPARSAYGDRGFGLSFGAGLSFDFSPRLSATVQWDSVDAQATTGGRDPVRSTSLGLKYRY